MFRRHILGDDGTRRDHSAVTYGHTFENDGPRSDEAAFADVDRSGGGQDVIAPAIVPQRDVKIRVGYEAVSPEQGACADDDLLGGGDGNAAHPRIFLKNDACPRSSTAET